MPIVKFATKLSDVPADAINLKIGKLETEYTTDEQWNALSDWSREYGAKRAPGPRCVFTWETHIGMCLRDNERNGYHDSDFYMTVWDDEAGKPFTVEYASTRGWTYPAMASRVDATPEVKAKYEAYCKASERKRRICNAWELRSKKIAIARAIGETNYKRLKKLDAAVPGYAGLYARTIELITSKRLRSNFKKSLQAQILAWYFDPSPKFKSPLSAKQWNYI